VDHQILIHRLTHQDPRGGICYAFIHLMNCLYALAATPFSYTLDKRLQDLDGSLTVTGLEYLTQSFHFSSKPQPHGGEQFVWVFILWIYCELNLCSPMFDTGHPLDKLLQTIRSSKTGITPFTKFGCVGRTILKSRLCSVCNCSLSKRSTVLWHAVCLYILMNRIWAKLHSQSHNLWGV